MGSEDNLMIISGVIQMTFALLVLVVSPYVGISFSEVKEFIVLIMGLNGGLVTAKHLIDKQKDKNQEA